MNGQKFLTENFDSMDIAKTEFNCNRTWYNNNQFPIIPIFTKKKGDEYNTKSFSFCWLFLKVWTLDAFQFEISFTADSHWGIGITALLPYLRIVFCIPCPMRLQRWIQKNLWRHSKKIK